jgi:hypothetical protein
MLDLEGQLAEGFERGGCDVTMCVKEGGNI